MIPVSDGEGSAQPGARKRRVRKGSAAKRNPEQRVLMQVMPDGSFRAADGISRKRLKSRGFHKHQPVIAYLYRVRDPAQWRRAHVLGLLLAEQVEDFHGLDAHAALKKAQLDGDVACETEELKLPAPLNMTIQRKVPRSLAFGEMDDAEFSAIYKQLANYIAHKYFPDMDADAVERMLNVMPDPA